MQETGTDPSMDDPTPRHLVLDPGQAAGPQGWFRGERDTVTSLSLLVTDPGDEAEHVLAAVHDWVPDRFRLEAVVVDDELAAGYRPRLAAALDRLTPAWTAVPRPSGGRARALDRATAESAGEFVVLARGTVRSFGPLSGALGQMWVNGADAVIVGEALAEVPRLDPPTVDHPTADRPAVDLPAAPGPGADGAADARALHLGAALGLRHAAVRDGIVVLRRWVARFLLGDIGRAIDAFDELAERVRLLDLRLVEVVSARDALRSPA